MTGRIRSHLTTVQNALVETLRVVLGVSIADPVELGEEVARYEPGTGLDVVRRELVRLAMESRGVDFCIDVYSHKGIWERFAHVCYDVSNEIDPATGVILNRTECDTDRTPAELIESEKARFEHDRAKRAAQTKRAANRGQKVDQKSATNH